MIIEKFKIHFKRNVKVYLCTFLVFLIILISISLLFAKNHTYYSNISLRMGVFYLGSIVTLNVYMYTKTQKISPLKFTFTYKSLAMFLGVILSIIMMIVPSYEIRDNVEFIEIFKLSSYKYNFVLKLLGCLNIFALSGATTIFLMSFYLFFKSFNINKQTKKSMLNIVKHTNVFSDFYNIDQKFALNNKYQNLTTIKRDTSNNAICKYLYQLKLNDLANEKKVLEAFKLEFLDSKLSAADLEILYEDMEIYVDHINYLIELNHNKYVKLYITEWLKIFNALNEFIYHSQNWKEYNELYEKNLQLTRKIINKTFNDYLHEKYFDQALDIFLGGVPLYNSKNGESSKLYYTRNYNKLSKIYFDVLMNMTEEIYFDKKYYEILSQYLTNNNFKNNVLKSDTVLIDNAKLNIKMEKYGEYLLVSLLYQCIIKNISSELPVLMALIMKTQDKRIFNSGNMRTSNSILEALKNLTQVYNKFAVNSIENRGKVPFIQAALDISGKELKSTNVYLSEELIKFIIYIIVKSCEIENYKAVGYLVKRLCDSYENKEVFLAILKNVSEKMPKNEHVSLKFSEIHLNEYSLDYCVNKAIYIIVIYLRYSKKLYISPKDYVDSKYRKGIRDSLDDKAKDYNLYCLNKDVLKKLGL